MLNLPKLPTVKGNSMALRQKLDALALNFKARAKAIPRATTKRNSHGVVPMSKDLEGIPVYKMRSDSVGVGVLRNLPEGKKSSGHKSRTF